MYKNTLFLPLQKFALWAFLVNGPLAEWLGKALQKLLQRFESARDLQIWLIKNVVSFYSAFFFIPC